MMNSKHKDMNICGLKERKSQFVFFISEYLWFEIKVAE